MVVNVSCWFITVCELEFQARNLIYFWTNAPPKGITLQIPDLAKG